MTAFDPIVFRALARSWPRATAGFPLERGHHHEHAGYIPEMRLSFGNGGPPCHGAVLGRDHSGGEMKENVSYSVARLSQVFTFQSRASDHDGASAAAADQVHDGRMAIIRARTTAGISAGTRWKKLQISSH